MTDVEEGDDEEDVVDATEAIEPVGSEPSPSEPSPVETAAASPPSWSPQPQPQPQPEIEFRSNVEQHVSQPEAGQSAPTSTPGDSQDSGAPED
jgi:hypothetical protein